MASVSPQDEESPLVAVVANSPTQTPKNHTKDIHILSVAFLLIFLAFGAAQNLQSTVNTSVCFSGGSDARVKERFGSWDNRLCVVRGCELEAKLVYHGSSLFLSWIQCFNYMGWRGNISYLAARNHARASNLHEGAVIGDFNGEFWAMFALHQFVGNLITFSLLRDGQGGSAKGTTLLFIVFLSIMALGVALMCLLGRTTDNNKEEGELSDADVVVYSSLKSLSKSLAISISDVRMLLTIPLIAYSGLQQAFVWAEFTKYAITPALGISGVGSAMAVYGAFDGICSLAAGRLSSGLTYITSIVSVGAFVQAVAVVLLLLNLSISSGFLSTAYHFSWLLYWALEMEF